MTDIPEEAYAAANEADAECGKTFCRRSDCNGFLCKNALDAAILSERSRQIERDAKIAEAAGRALRESAAIARDSEDKLSEEFWHAQADAMDDIAAAIRAQEPRP